MSVFIEYTLRTDDSKMINDIYTAQSYGMCWIRTQMIGNGLSLVGLLSLWEYVEANNWWYNRYLSSIITTVNMIFTYSISYCEILPLRIIGSFILHIFLWHHKLAIALFLLVIVEEWGRRQWYSRRSSWKEAVQNVKMFVSKKFTDFHENMTIKLMSKGYYSSHLGQ